MEREVADWPVRRYRYHHYDFPNLLSLPSLFRHRGMRVEPSQGCGLVRNLAGLLGDPVEVAGNKLRLPIFIVIARVFNRTLRTRGRARGAATKMGTLNGLTVACDAATNSSVNTSCRACRHSVCS